jgi:hypothetical protein
MQGLGKISGWDLHSTLEIFRRVPKISKSKYYLCYVCLSVCLSVRPSARMQQLGSHWTDFHEIWYLHIFRESVQKIHVPLKYGKNNGGYFTWRPLDMYDNISLNFS